MVSNWGFQMVEQKEAKWAGQMEETTVELLAARKGKKKGRQRVASLALTKVLNLVGWLVDPMELNLAVSLV